MKSSRKPASRWWFNYVQEGVLAKLTTMVDKATASGVMVEETQLLVGAWRALLRLHEQDRGRHCAVCGSGRSAKPICSVWQVAIAYFIRHITT